MMAMMIVMGVVLTKGEDSTVWITSKKKLIERKRLPSPKSSLTKPIEVRLSSTCVLGAPWLTTSLPQ